MNIVAIHNEAKQAAIKAENNYLNQYGGDAYCGFAWVDVYVERTNSKQAKLLKEVGFENSLKKKCLTMWTCGDYCGQSISVKEEGAQAFAAVLQKYGFRAYVGSSADKNSF
jgi:4-hydroxyphenylpyruvate dioxygenase-like putative hemolysin